jgi:hypothetical protein
VKLLKWTAVGAFVAAEAATLMLCGPVPLVDPAPPCGERGVADGFAFGRTISVCTIDGEAMHVRVVSMTEQLLTTFFGHPGQADEYIVQILGRGRSPVVPLGATTKVFAFLDTCARDVGEVVLHPGREYVLIVRWENGLKGYTLPFEATGVFEVRDGQLTKPEYAPVDLAVEGRTPDAFLKRVHQVCLEDERHPVKSLLREPKNQGH